MKADDAALTDELFHQAVELVHQHRAASTALIQRHLRIGSRAAEALLERMAAETMVVRKMQNGLYLYIHGPIGEELARLTGFTREVLSALTTDRVDADQPRGRDPTRACERDHGFRPLRRVMRMRDAVRVPRRVLQAKFGRVLRARQNPASPSLTCLFARYAGSHPSSSNPSANACRKASRGEEIRSCPSST